MAYGSCKVGIFLVIEDDQQHSVVILTTLCCLSPLATLQEP